MKSQIQPTGKIAYTSPVAKQLMGAKINDIILLKTPEQSRKVKIIEIS